MKAKVKLHKLLSLLLALALVVTLLPGMGMTALAVEDGSTDPPAQAVTGIVPPPPFPLNERNRDEQRTSPTGIPADNESRYFQKEITGDWKGRRHTPVD